MRDFRFLWEDALMAQSSAPAGAKLMAWALRQYLNDGQRQCWPTQEQIAGRTGQGVRTVRRATDWLEKNGWIATRKNFHPDGSYNLVYTIRFPDWFDQDHKNEQAPKVAVIELDPRDQAEALRKKYSA